MSRQESRHPEDWLTKARQDLARVRVLLDVDDPEGAGFHLQQAVEKALKAFLLSQGVMPRRIHDLGILLDEVGRFRPDLEQFRGLCDLATDLYMPQRYPFLAVQPPAKAEVEALLAQAQALLQKIEEVFAP